MPLTVMAESHLMGILAPIAGLLFVMTCAQGASLLFHPWTGDDNQKSRATYAWRDSKPTTLGWNPAQGFCHGLETPKYKVVKKTADYEQRSYYQESRWISANMTGTCYDTTELLLYTKLFLYYHGWNMQRQRLNMTCPVVGGITGGTLPTDPFNYQIFFYLSPKIKAPPAPIDPSIFVHVDKPSNVYVSSFPGFATEDKFSKEASKLLAALQKAKVKVYTKTYFVAGYDAPYRLHHRHNEVWFVAE